VTADQLRSLQPALAALLEEFRGAFQRQRTFEHWQCYLLGLLADLKRKSIEPIALAAGVAVRTLQEFLAFFRWDHAQVARQLQRLVADRHGGHRGGIGVLDASAHPKQGDQTPGVQRQWCGQTGKLANCVVGQHLLYTDADPQNPFSCMLASDLYLPESWAQDRARCQAAGIPDTLAYRAKWQIALAQVQQAVAAGIRFDWLTFDEEYGGVAPFWFGLDALGQRGIGEARSNFHAWATWPTYRSFQPAHAPRRIDHLCRHSPVFRDQDWQRLRIKETTRGAAVWDVKAARIHLVVADPAGRAPQPSERRYWLILARSRDAQELKYFISNAAEQVGLTELLRAAFTRWQVEQWFERAKQEAGLGAFEVRTYTSLMRHWLSARIAMYFLAAQTQRLRGEKSAPHARASGRSRQRAGRPDLPPLLAFMEGTDRPQPVLPGA
jgi:SRSO17 transposase